MRGAGGIVLIVALFVIAIISTLLTASLTRTFGEQLLARRWLQHEQTFGLAEGKALDLLHAASTEGLAVGVTGTTDYAALAGSRLVVVAAGLAIIGSPLLDIPSSDSINISGFVMASSGSRIAADGYVYGGVVGVTPLVGADLGIGGPPAFPLTWMSNGEVDIGGGAHIIFKPLPGTPPGFPSGSGGGGGTQQPTVLLWSD